MHSEKLQAFVLSSLDYGDSDRIVSLFTLEHGRIKAFAQGARKSRKRFGPALEPFARIDVQARIKGGLSSLQQADIVCIYPAIRADLERIAHALYACELVDAITPEGHPLPRLFRLLAAYLDRLETTAASESDRRFFELNLLNILGYRPALEGCSRCDSPFGETGALLQDGGELACRFCAAGGRPLTGATLNMLQACLRTGTFGLIAFPPEALAQTAALLDEAVASHAGRRMKSAEFLRQINRE
jgi:DNA repair protein RecO (recombination protein O)